MRTDFSLEQLTLRYIKALSPYVFSNKRKEKVPLYVAYDDLMQVLYADDEKAATYRKELMGNNPILSAPTEYWELGLAKEVAPTYTDFKAMPIHDRAKVRAWSFLHNAAELLERYLTDMEERRKRVFGGKGK